MSQQDNHLVTPANQAREAWAKNAILNHLEQQSRELPCIVKAIPQDGFVTVSFQVQAAAGQKAVTIPDATIPVAESLYVRIPIVVGDKGITMGADAYLNEITGQGGGMATLGQPMNLGGLVFVPLANATWPTRDRNQLTMSGGSSGVKVQSNTMGGSSIVMTDSSITLTVGGHSIIINASGITLDGILWDTHSHSYLVGGPSVGNTGGPV